jgi:hypothetical protein
MRNLLVIFSIVIAWCAPAVASECMAIDGFELDESCDVVLGWGWTGGTCAEISGCSTTTTDGHDLSPYLLKDEASCYGSCAACPVVDPSDFGMCQMIVGVAWTGTACETVSGCGTLDGGGIDRADWFYPDTESCELGCGPCLDLEKSDFGACDLWLGYGLSGGECAGLSGCSSTDQNQTEQDNWLFGTEEECGDRCEQCAVVDKDGFGSCKMAMGWAWTGATCEDISGCGPDDMYGVDWSSSFYQSYGKCLKSCQKTTRLYTPDPGVVGERNKVRIGGVPEGERVRLFMSMKVGEKTLSGCPGAVVNLMKPDKLGERVANAKGNVKFRNDIPKNMAGETVYFQAVNWDTCEVSNLLAHDF